jgi:hypothetical protein
VHDVKFTIVRKHAWDAQDWLDEVMKTFEAELAKLRAGGP